MMTTGVFALLLMQVMLTRLAPVDAQCSFPAQLQTTNLPLTIARNFNIQTQAKDVVQMDVTSGTSISFIHLRGYSLRARLATWNCVNVTSAGNTFVVMVTDFGGTTPVTYYTCVSFTSVTTNIWLLWQQSPGIFNTSDAVLCNNLIRNSWPIVILPVTAQMPPIPSAEQGGYDVTSTYVISSQTNLSCISAAAPSVVGRVDIGCGASRTDCTLLLPPSCQAPVLVLDGFAPFMMSVIAWWQERNYNYFILNNYAQQMACLRIQRSGTNVTSSSSLSAILFTDVTCPDTPYNATNPDMTVFSNALLLTLKRTSFMTSLCADQYASCSALAPTQLTAQCDLTSQQCIQTCSKCTPTISAFYPNNFTCISSSISGHWTLVGSDKRTASLQASSISFDYENRTLSCLLQQAAVNISSSGGSLSYPMVMMQANGCYPRMMCITASLIQPASFQLEFQRVAAWPDTTLTLFDPKTLCTQPPTSSSDPTLILLATPRQPVNCGLVLTNSITGLITNPIYNITAVGQSNVTTAVMQSSCDDPTKLNIISGDLLFMSAMFNQPPNFSTSSLQLRCLASFLHPTVNVVTMLLDTGSEGSSLYCIVVDNMNNKLYFVSLNDCSGKAYGRIGAMTTSTVPVVYEFENRTFYTCPSSASANISDSGGPSTQPVTSFHSPISSANVVKLHHLSATVVACHLLLALVAII